jgi:hypothetical protein
MIAYSVMVVFGCSTAAIIAFCLLHDAGPAGGVSILYGWKSVGYLV